MPEHKVTAATRLETKMSGNKDGGGEGGEEASDAIFIFTSFDCSSALVRVLNTFGSLKKGIT